MSINQKKRKILQLKISLFLFSPGEEREIGWLQDSGSWSWLSCQEGRASEDEEEEEEHEEEDDDEEEEEEEGEEAEAEGM